MRYRKQIYAGVLLVCVSLCGCSGNPLKERVYEEFDRSISTNEDYLEYQKIISETANPEVSNALTADNTEGQVLVSFAVNSYLDLKYYADEAMEKPIENTIRMNPGDSVYYSILDVNNKNTILYSFDRFNVVEYSSDGKSTPLDGWTGDLNSSIAFTIPENYAGESVSIIPIGKFNERHLILDDQLVLDDKEEGEDLANYWYINGHEEDGTDYYLSGTENCKVTYRYTYKDYFLLEANPTPQFHDDSPDEEGYSTLYFDTLEPTQPDQTYEIRLHKRITAAIKLSKGGTVTFNDGEPEKVKKNKKWTSTILKPGDKITVESDAEPEITKGKWYLSSYEKRSQNEYVYTVMLEDSADHSDAESVNITLDTNDKYGKCYFTLDDKQFSGKVTVYSDQELVMHYTTYEGYEIDYPSNGIFSKLKNLKNDKKNAEIPIKFEDLKEGQTISRKTILDVKGE